MTTTSHTLARIIDDLMRYGLSYMKQTEAAYAEQIHERFETQWRRRAKELGYTLNAQGRADGDDRAIYRGVMVLCLRIRSTMVSDPPLRTNLENQTRP